MRIADVLRSKGSDVATIPPGASVGDLIAELATHNVGALPALIPGGDGGVAGIKRGSGAQERDDHAGDDSLVDYRVRRRQAHG